MSAATQCTSMPRAHSCPSCIPGSPACCEPSVHKPSAPAWPPNSPRGAPRRLGENMPYTPAGVDATPRTCLAYWASLCLHGCSLLPSYLSTTEGPSPGRVFQPETLGLAAPSAPPQAPTVVHAGLLEDLDLGAVQGGGQVPPLGGVEALQGRGWDGGQCEQAAAVSAARCKKAPGQDLHRFLDRHDRKAPGAQAEQGGGGGVI